MSESNDELIGLAAGIVAAYVTNNSVTAADLPNLIANTHAALRNLGATVVEAPVAQTLVPAVPIRKSITPDAIICLEDGKKFKTLKRHLGTAYGMTPEQYRAKWNLPNDYPMVAPAYAEARSQMAKKLGLGQKTKGARRSA